MSFDPKILTAEQAGVAVEVFAFIAMTTDPNHGLRPNAVAAVIRAATDAFQKLLGDRPTSTPGDVRAELEGILTALKAPDHMSALAALRQTD